VLGPSAPAKQKGDSVLVYPGGPIVGAYREGGEQSQKLPLGFIIMEFLVHEGTWRVRGGCQVRRGWLEPHRPPVG
jgi:hypothetical protein